MYKIVVFDGYIWCFKWDWCISNVYVYLCWKMKLLMIIGKYEKFMNKLYEFFKYYY